jgi:hypothetical protein
VFLDWGRSIVCVPTSTGDFTIQGYAWIFKLIDAYFAANAPSQAAGLPPLPRQRLFHDDLVNGAGELIDKSDCGNFLVRVAQTAFLNIAGKTSPNDLSPGERAYYDDITAANIKGRLQRAYFGDARRSETDRFGNTVSAHAEYGNDGINQSVIFYDAFFDHGKKEQHQIVTHEGMHLIFRLGDADLARGAGVYERDGNASERFQNELKKNCH